MRFSKQQVSALEFFELEARDPAMLLLTRAPPTRTRNWLLAHLYLERELVGQFEFLKYRLTDSGLDALAHVKITQRTKHKPRENGERNAELPGEKRAHPGNRR